MTTRFNGSDYQPMRDDVRLTKQLMRVWDAVKDGSWKTLSQIAAEASAPESSVSAQLRHLRKPRFGSHEVQKQHMGHGLYKYRVIPNDERLVR